MSEWRRSIPGRGTPLGSLDPYLSALVSGAALVFSFPAFDLWPLAWVALVPFFYTLSRLGPKESLRSGFVLGMVYFFGTQYWIYHSVHNYGGVPLIPSLLVVAALAVCESLYITAFAVLLSITLRSVRLPVSLLAPILWVPLEYLRAYMFTGFPWSSIGYTQYQFLHIIQVADITGVYGVTFLVVAVNGAVADMVLSFRALREKPLYSLSVTGAAAAFVVLLAAGAYIYGDMRLKEERPGTEAVVSVVQGNIPQDVKWDADYQRDVMDTYKRLSTGAGFKRPALVVWPEAALPFFWGSAATEDMALADELRRFQRGRESYLLFGAVVVSGPGELTNSAIMLDGTGEEVYRYDKIHLVPFGEYVPLRRVFFFLDKLVVGIGDYRAGTEHKRGSVPFGEFATLICYEIIFPGLVRRFYRDNGAGGVEGRGARGAGFMVTITNDAWFGRTSGPYQHFSMAVLRAVENRKPLIRAANTGISGFIDSNGKIINKTGLFERRVLTEKIRTDGTLTVYTKYGDLFAYACVVLSIIILFHKRR